MLNFNWLENVSELWGRILIIVTLIIPLVFTLTLKNEYIFRDAPDTHRWRNLKVWTAIIVILQIAIYIYF